MNRWLIRKVPDAGTNQGQKERRASEDEIVGWYHQCNEHELGQTPGDGEGWGCLECFSPWGLHGDMIGQLDKNKKLLKTDRDEIKMVQCVCIYIYPHLDR